MLVAIAPEERGAMVIPAQRTARAGAGGASGLRAALGRERITQRGPFVSVSISHGIPIGSRAGNLRGFSPVRP